jgi:hypothetical protein
MLTIKHGGNINKDYVLCQQNNLTIFFILIKTI